MQSRREFLKAVAGLALAGSIGSSCAADVSAKLVQLHWQNHDDLKQTILVAEKRFTDGQAAMDWVRQTVMARRAELPKGWQPVVTVWENPNVDPEAVTRALEKAGTRRQANKRGV